MTESAVEEFLRYDGPVPATLKISLEDREWQGRHLRRGDRVFPFLGSANRDPLQFDQPDRLDVTRRPGRSLAFGFGIHFCLGAWLARAELQEAFRVLAERVERIELDGDIEWKPQSDGIWGPARLPVRF